MRGHVERTPQVGVRLAVVVSVMAGFAIGGCAKEASTPATQGAAVTPSLKRPFDPALWEQYRDSCTKETFASPPRPAVLRYPKAKPIVHLSLRAHDGAHQGTISALEGGRFVGIIENSDTGSLAELNVTPGTASAPSRTCVWIEKTELPGTFQAWLVSAVGPPTLRQVERIIHQVSIPQPQACPHTFPAAAWRDRGMEDRFGCPGSRSYRTEALPDQFTVPLEPATPEELAEALKTFWFTCDLVGCCKGL